MIGRDQFVVDYDVPRGTLEKFDLYAELLVDWQQRMNLVGPSTVAALWERHFSDSAQLVSLSARTGHWLDVGSGAGFPGIVVALLGVDQITLVDSVAKKCRFLSEVVDKLELGNRVMIVNARIEALPRFAVSTVTARACAPLERLFGWGLRFAGRSTRWLLPKGVTALNEVAAARAAFDFDATLIPSRTEPTARIVVAENVRSRLPRA